MAIATFMKTKAYQHWSFVVFGAVAFGVLWLIAAEDRWEARVYSDGADLTVFQALGEYPSLDQCRTIALAQMADMGAVADYACALNCAADGGHTMCEDTKK